MFHLPHLSRWLLPRGLRATLMGLVLLAVLPALGLALHHGLVQRAHAKADAKNAAVAQALTLAAAQREQLTAAHRLVRTLAATTVVRVIDPQGCSRLFSQLMRQSGPGICNILAVSATGERIAEAAPGAGDAFAPGHTPLGVATYADRPWFALAVTTKTCQIGPFVAAPDGRPVAVIACPSISWDDTVKAVVAASLTLDALAGSVAANPPPPGSLVGVLTPARRLLATFPETSPRIGDDLSDTPLGRAARGIDSGSRETAGLSGAAKLVGFARIIPGDAASPVVFVSVPLSKAYAAADALLRAQLGWLAVVGILGLGVAWLFGSRLLVRPITTLVAAAEHIGQGVLTTRLTETPHTLELARLGRAFNAMAGELEQRDRVLARKTVELQNSNKDLEQFAYIASHDLQEPLRKITSFAELLDKRFSDQLDDTGRRYINYMVDGARRMSQLINHLLAYSRLGTRGGDFAAFALDAALDMALDNLEVPLREAEATVTRGELPVLVGDATQITQLFQNIIGNAIKYRALRPPRVHISAVREDGAWTIAVADNGIGIAPQHFDRVFRMFQRLHTTGERPGAGIGLSFCKRIVERHGGAIRVESKEGEGSTFLFTLPDLEESAS